MAEVYKIFARTWEHVLDFSEDALKEMYKYESCGTSITRSDNGYEVGKKYLNLHVTMWKADIQDGLLKKEELYADIFPHWWLDQVLSE